jgi:hypothetical protein
MESKLPSSLESEYDEFPRGVDLPLTPVQWVFFVLLLGIGLAFLGAFAATLYVVIRFMWALVSRQSGV